MKREADIIEVVKVANKFMKALIALNFEALLELTTVTWREKYKEKAVEQLKATLSAYNQPGAIDSYEIDADKIEIIGLCMIDVPVKTVTYGSDIATLHKLRLVCEKAAYEPSINGTWGANPISFLRTFEVEK